MGSDIMINKIKEIKNIDAFDSFSWQADDFKRYNLIYGWNGSGKTTVSRLFSFLEKRRIELPEYKSIEFSIQSDARIYKGNDLETHDLDIRVFNEIFINENISFNDSKAKQIIMIGRENIELQKEIKLLEDEKRKAIDEHGKLRGKQPKVPKHEQILTEAAGEVPKQFGNTPLANDAYYGRNYRKNKVEDLLSKGLIREQDLDHLIIADPDILADHREVIKQEKEAVSFTLAELQDMETLFVDANNILKSDLYLEEITELIEDKELRDWTEVGFRIHSARKLDICQFCHNRIPPELFHRLSKYFTAELEETKGRIDKNIIILNKQEIPGPPIDLDSSMLFPDIAKDYLKAKKSLEIEGNSIKETIINLIHRLESKKEALQTKAGSVEGLQFPADHVSAYNEAVFKINGLIIKHNGRVKESRKEISEAARRIELHTIASIFIDKEYFRHKKESEELDSQLRDLEQNRDRLSKDISTKLGALKNTGLAVDKINQMAKEYFGEGQIYLDIPESATGNEGYVLKTRGKIAKHLSEGEKSILALIYFFVKLEEEGCNKSSCIVVIDDPVDSQDAIFLFRTFGLLKRQLNSAKQLLLFTHNYDFFNLVRDWFISDPNKDRSHLYRISIITKEGKRELLIEDLPKLLKEYKSEYQYLFGQLYLYANGKGTLDAPLVPNVARKLLEYFAAFKWACRTSEQFSSIVLNRFVKNQEHLRKGVGDFILKFVNENSHGQDFSRPITATMFEAKDIAKGTLEFIRFADKEHYNDLKCLCDPT